MKTIPANNSQLRLLVSQVRLDILDMVEQAGSGHIDSSFSCAEIIATLYSSWMHHDPSEPNMPGRDRFILSKGHAAPALYSVLARQGYFDPSELLTLRRLHSRLQGHPKKGLPGIELNTGSLGQGLSVAAGLALGLSRRPNEDIPRVFTLLSDGELNEGQTWEALMFGAHQHLGNLIAIVDGNGLQYTGTTHDVSDMSGFGPAIQALGWAYVEVNGHSTSELLDALDKQHSNKPLLIFADTVKGKGGLFLENDLAWHGKLPSSEQIFTLRSYLKQQLKETESA